MIAMVTSVVLMLCSGLLLWNNTQIRTNSFSACCLIVDVCRQVRYWNVPMVTAGAMASDFGTFKKTTYSLLTRVGHSFNSLSAFITSTLQWFGSVFMIFRQAQGRSQSFCSGGVWPSLRLPFLPFPHFPFLLLLYFARGSAVSSPGGIRGRAPAATAFWCFYVKTHLMATSFSQCAMHVTVLIIRI